MDAADLDDYQPYAYNPTYSGADVSLDYVMDYSVICDELSHPGFGHMCFTQDITPRLMFNTGPQSQFKVV